MDFSGTVLGAVIGIALHHLIGSAQADPWGTLAVIVVAMSVGAYFITVNYAAFVTCLVIMLAQLYPLTAPGGLDILLAYRLEENLLGAAVGLLVALLVLPVPTGAVIRTGLHGYLQALVSFAADLGTHLTDPDAADREPHHDHRGPRPPGRRRRVAGAGQFRQARPQSALPVDRGTTPTSRGRSPRSTTSTGT